MSKAEETFKTLVVRLIQRGTYPGPTAINNARLGTHFGTPNNINGRECKWRAQVLLDQGFYYESPEVSGKQRGWTKWEWADGKS